MTNFTRNGYVGPFIMSSVQVGTSEIKFNHTDGYAVQLIGVGVDTTYPYNTYGQFIGNDYDSPVTGLELFVRKLWKSDDLRMVLMFQPVITNGPNTNTIPVPLKEIHWNWIGTATNANPPGSTPDWQPTTPANAAITTNNLNTFSFPQWTNNITDKTQTIFTNWFE